MRLDITESNLAQRLKVMARHGRTLCGRTAKGEPLGAATEKFLNDLADGVSDPAKVKERNEFLARAEKDPATHRQLCAIRLEQFNNYIYASQNIINMFFEQVDLAPDERPVFQNNTDQEINVTYVGADGQPNEIKVVRSQDEALIDLHFLTTDEVNYRKIDPYRGNVVDAALQTIHLAYDMTNQMEAKAFSLLNATPANGGAFGAFTFAGKRCNYSFVKSGRINLANLPATNKIVVPGTTGATKFRYAVLKAAKKYGGQWGNAFMDGPLVPTGRILIPSLDASDIADEIVPSGQTSNPVADQLLEQGWATISYLGRNWTLVEDNTLTPGKCYPEYNRKPGRVYGKSALDEESVDDSYAQKKKNRESRFNRKIFGAYINNATRAFCAELTYKS